MLAQKWRHTFGLGFRLPQVAELFTENISGQLLGGWTLPQHVQLLGNSGCVKLTMTAWVMPLQAKISNTPLAYLVRSWYWASRALQAGVSHRLSAELEYKIAIADAMGDDAEVRRGRT